MKKKKQSNAKYEMGSGNAFADLGPTNSEEALAKAQLLGNLLKLSGSVNSLKNALPQSSRSPNLKSLYYSGVI